MMRAFFPLFWQIGTRVLRTRLSAVLLSVAALWLLHSVEAKGLDVDKAKSVQVLQVQAAQSVEAQHVVRVAQIKAAQTVGISIAQGADAFVGWRLTPITNAADAVLPAASLNIQWQEGSDAAADHASWRDIPSANLTAYQPDYSRFETHPFLRAVVRDIAPSPPGSFVTTTLTSNIANALMRVTGHVCASGGVNGPCIENNFQSTGNRFACHRCDVSGLGGGYGAPQWLGFGSADTLDQISMAAAANLSSQPYHFAAGNIINIPNTWDVQYPMIAVAFVPSSGAVRVQNVIRVLGLVTDADSAITINNNLSVVLVSVSNVLGVDAGTWELSYQWQGMVVGGTWEDITDATLSYYEPTFVNVATYPTVRVVARDLAPESILDDFVPTVRLTSSPLVVGNYFADFVCNSSNEPCLVNNHNSNPRLIACSGCNIGGAPNLIGFGVAGSLDLETLGNAADVATQPYYVGSIFTHEITDTWNVEYPMIAATFPASTGRKTARNALRVMGLRVGGDVSITVAQGADSFVGWRLGSINVMNVLGTTAQAWEFGYQWQEGSGASASGASWRNIPNATLTAYQPDYSRFATHPYLRVVVRDIAPESPLDDFVPVLTLTSAGVDALARAVDYNCAGGGVNGANAPCIENNYQSVGNRFACQGCNAGILEPHWLGFGSADTLDQISMAAVANLTSQPYYGARSYVFNIPNTWNVQYPMVAAAYTPQGGGAVVRVQNVVRVLGLVRNANSAITINNNLSVVLVSVSNVLDVDAGSWEMSYQWQSGGGGGAWTDIAGATLSYYQPSFANLLLYPTVRVIARDLAPESILDNFVPTVTLTSSPMTVAANYFAQFICNTSNEPCLINNPSNPRMIACNGCSASGTPNIIAFGLAGALDLEALSNAPNVATQPYYVGNSFPHEITDAWNVEYPMIAAAFPSSTGSRVARNFVRVLGLVENANSAININSNMMAVPVMVSNVLGTVAESWEFNYQWQGAQSARSSEWQDIAGQTAATYRPNGFAAIATYPFVRVVARDLAPESPLDDFVPTVVLTSAPVNVVDMVTGAACNAGSTNRPCVAQPVSGNRNLICHGCNSAARQTLLRRNDLSNPHWLAFGGADSTDLSALATAPNLSSQPYYLFNNVSYDINLADVPLQYPMLGAVFLGNNGDVVETSNAIRVLGIRSARSGAIAITLGGRSWQPDLSRVVNVLGLAPAAAHLGYQWQRATDNNARSWEDIPNATASRYDASRADFPGGNRYLRLVAADIAPESPLDDFRATVRITSNAIRVDEVHLGATLSNAVLSYVVQDVFDLIPAVHWQIGNSLGGTYTPLLNADGRTITTASYAVPLNHPRDKPYLRAAAVFLFGGVLRTVFSPEIKVGGVIFSADSMVDLEIGGYTPGATLRTNISGLTDVLGRVITTPGIYQWQTGASATGAWQPISAGGSAASYELNRNDFAQSRSWLRVRFVDDFGLAASRKTIYSTPLNVNQLPTGNLIPPIVRTNATADITITLNRSELRDANNTLVDGGSIRYVWRANGAELGRDLEYILRVADAALTVISVQAFYSDDMGFEQVFLATILFRGDFIATKPESLRRVVAVLNALSAESAAAVVGAQLDSIGSFDSGAFVEINETRLDGFSNVLGALSRRAPDSLYEGRDLAVDSFAAHSVGGVDGGGAWSAWARGNWGTLEGDPVIDGHTVNYSGDSTAFYGGYDRQINGIRVGFSAGHSEINLDASLTKGTSDKQDRIQRELVSFLPYVEWRRGGNKLRLVGGYGFGDTIIEERGACLANMSADWMFGLAAGELAFIESNHWNASGLANLVYSRSRIGQGACSNDVAVKIPGADAVSGEWALGGRVGYRSSDSEYSVRPHIGINMRRPFGDLTDDLTYDVVGGVSFGGKHLVFDVEGRQQLTKTTHQRNSFSGQVKYHRGGVISSWRTEWEAARGAGAGEVRQLLHRWEVGYADDWGLNTIGTKLYVESPIGGSGNSYGAEMRLTFGDN